MQLEYFLLMAAALFCIGIYGLVSSRNVIRVLMSIELMLNAVNINLMAFSNYLDSAAIKGKCLPSLCLQSLRLNRRWVWQLCSPSIAIAILWIWSSLIC